MPNRSKFAVAEDEDVTKKLLSLDVVRLATDFAYLDAKVAKELNFKDVSRLQDINRRRSTKSRKSNRSSVKSLESKK